MPRFDASAIQRYYDRQTAGFVALGQGGSEGAIHRAVWGPGVATRAQAFHFVDDRIAERLAARDPVPDGSPEGRGFSPADALPHVVDLGCGVGGSLIYLASRLPVRATGITLSPVQAEMATARIQALGLADRVSCLEGDYTALPASVAAADLAFAVESFVHGPSPQAFFASAARLVRPGGWLAICDDVRRPSPDPHAAGAVDRFAKGWHVNTLLTRDELVASAAAEGFAHRGTTDLTPWLELGRPRDRVIGMVVGLFGWLPLERTRVAHIVGGHALQTCLRRGWVGYELSWFQRTRGHRRCHAGRCISDAREAGRARQAGRAPRARHSTRRTAASVSVEADARRSQSNRTSPPIRYTR